MEIRRTRPPQPGEGATPRHTAAPRPEHRFPCHGCGAGLEFSPGQSKLECPYCGATQELPQSEGEVRELAYQDYFRSIQLCDLVATGTLVEVHCPKCGADAQFPANVAADRCPFCSAHIDSPPKAPEKTFPVQGLVPFKVQQREAREAFSKWVNSRWFAPNNLKKMALLGRIDGIYIPFWTYDSFTVTFYTGLRGDHYWETVRDSKGNSRQVMKTRWRPAAGRVNHWFDDVLVCASQGLPEKLIRPLEPWDLAAIEPFNAAMLPGFKVERYQLPVAGGFEKAKVYMNETLEQLVRQDIGGDVQKITTMKTQYDGVTFKHILLPLWISAYNYQGKVYRLLVNARTGEVQGERPWSWIKITLAVLAAAIVVGVVVYFSEK